MNTNDVTALTRIYAKGINEMIDEYITLDELGGIFADLEALENLSTGQHPQTKKGEKTL